MNLGISIPKPELITFDFGDTLVTSEPSYFKRIAMSLTTLDFERTEFEVEQSYHRADLRHAQEILKQAPFDNDTYIRTFSAALLDELKIKGDRKKILAELAETLLGFRPERVLMPGAREILEKLKAHGIMMGVISNNDGRTRRKCEDVDISKYFGFILDSTVEKVMKPDPRIFRRALEEAGVEGKKALHVGDLWGSDVIGATNAGVSALWLEKPYLDPPDLPDTARIKNLLEIESLLKPG